MKKILATAIVALTPSAAMADETGGLDGFLSASAGYSSSSAGQYTYADSYGNQNSGDSNYKVSGLDVEMRATGSIPIAGSLSAQIDGIVSRTYQKQANCSGCNRDHSDDSTVATHLFVRNSHKGLIGAFAQRNTFNTNYGNSKTTLYVGGEGQVYMGRVTFSGQWAYAYVDSYYAGLKNNGLTAAMKFRYFPQDNLQLELRGSHSELRGNPSSRSGYNCPSYCYTTRDVTWDIGGKAEYRLPHSRFSVFAEGDYGDLGSRNNYNNNPYWYQNDQKFNNLRALVGVKVSFGSGTLFERDRSGAALDPAPELPNNSYSFER